jgi:hypothetical protein
VLVQQVLLLVLLLQVQVEELMELKQLYRSDQSQHR